MFLFLKTSKKRRCKINPFNATQKYFNYSLFPLYWKYIDNKHTRIRLKHFLYVNFNFLIRFIHLDRYLLTKNMIIFSFGFIDPKHENKPYFCYLGNPRKPLYIHTFIRLYRVTKQPLDAKKKVIIIMQKPMIHQYNIVITVYSCTI